MLRYVARDQTGTWVALLGYSSASLHLRVRDEWLDWTPEQRARRLRLVTQNSRFLILPGVACPNLASRLLKLAGQQREVDFPRVHGHPVVMVESFVDPQLYRGACYQAAGRQALGALAGGRTLADLATICAELPQTHLRALWAWQNKRAA